ncbi:MAG: sigma-70 family RNA polymerase sigma factor [Verrucomicrobia bacterium]|nr:sigma-70 family RNA polymerase sigma factor [Verrucomicrobiota bacterium]
MNSSEQQTRFEQWVREHGAILHHVVHGFAEGDDRNDLMQEILLALWKAAPAFRQDSRPSTFIYQVSHNAALTWKRTQRSYRRRLERFEAELPAEAQAPNPADEPALLERVYREIRRLPPLDRSLILLSLDGVRYADMAQIHGITESHVGVRLHRARRQLSETLKAFRHEP